MPDLKWSDSLEASLADAAEREVLHLSFFHAPG